MKSVADIFGIETITKDAYRYALTHSSFTKEKSCHTMNVTKDLSFWEMRF